LNARAHPGLLSQLKSTLKALEQNHIKVISSLDAPSPPLSIAGHSAG
jgi:hypothetical protein